MKDYSLMFVVLDELIDKVTEIEDEFIQLIRR